jgi:hypothetical protein
VPPLSPTWSLVNPCARSYGPRLLQPAVHSAGGDPALRLWDILTQVCSGTLLPGTRGTWGKGGALRPQPRCSQAPTWRGAAPQSPRRGPARPASSSPPPLGGRASRSSSPGPRGRPGKGDCDGSPVSSPRLAGSSPPGTSLSPLPRRLLGETESSVMAPASIFRFRGCPGCAVSDGGTQSGGGGGSSVKSQSRSRFQGTWNVSGSAARRLAMGPEAWGKLRGAERTRAG